MFLKIQNLEKIFKNPYEQGSSIALKNFSLEIEQGEWVTLFGPSGCGKTTTLRMIAGLEKPTSGDIFLEEEKITSLPAHKRNFAMAFQSPSLFPQFSVEENISYGLKIRKMSKLEIMQKVSEMLSLIQLEGLKTKFPDELSGGQQQRVSLARAFIVKPKLLLLDEPFSSLDAELRSNLRQEVRKLQKKFKITTIYVTHDKEEAIKISDRIVCMVNGEVSSIETI